MTVTVLGTTATQALISYTSPDSNPCTIQVSTSPTLSPLLTDVDPGTFAGSNSDLSRPSTQTNGNARLVTIGERGGTDMLATAGAFSGIRHFSRTAQNATTYFGNVACTAISANFTFSTTNIPLGQTLGDLWLQSPGEPGMQPYPETIDGITPEFTTDPYYGTLLERIDLRSNDYSCASSIGGRCSGAPVFATAYEQGQNPCTGVNWVNPCGTITTGGSGSTTITNNSAVLVLRPPMTTTNELPAPSWGQYTQTWNLDQMQLQLTGQTSSGSIVLSGCYALSSVCATAPAAMTFTSSSTTQTVGTFSLSSYGVDPYLMASKPRINMQKIVPDRGPEGSAFTVASIATGGSGPSSFTETFTLSLTTSNCNPATAAQCGFTVGHFGLPVNSGQTLLNVPWSITAVSGVTVTVSTGSTSFSNCSSSCGTFATDPIGASVSGSVVTFINSETGNDWNVLDWTNGGTGRIRLSTISSKDACLATGSLGSADYTITSVIDGNNITVSPTPPSTVQWWCENNFTVLLWTPTPSAATLTLTGAKFAQVQGQDAFIPDNGASNGCLSTQINGWWPCDFGGVFWMQPSGNVAFFGGRTVPNTLSAITNGFGASGGIDQAGTANIDQTLTTSLCNYTVAGGGPGNGPVLVQACFLPSPIATPSTPFFDGNGYGNVSYSVPLTSTAYSATYADGNTYTNMTPQNSGGTCETITCQMAAFDTRFNTAVFGSANGNSATTAYGTSQGIVFIDSSSGGLDSYAWGIAYYVGDNNPAHAGCPPSAPPSTQCPGGTGVKGGPRVIGSMPTFDTPNCTLYPTNCSTTSFANALTGRSLHAFAETGETGYIQINTHFAPTKNTTATTIPSSSITTCASFGVIGNTNPCIQLTIDSYTAPSPCVTACTGFEPHIASGNGFVGAPGELRTTEVGDTVCASSTTCNYLGGSEFMELLVKGGSGVWTFQRAVNGTTQKPLSGTTTLFWFSINSVPLTGIAAGNGMTVYWNPLTGCSGSPDPHGNCLIQSINSNGGHGEWRDGGSAESVNVPQWNTQNPFQNPNYGFDSYPSDYQTIAGSVPSILTGYAFANNVPGSVTTPGTGVNYTSISPPFGYSTTPTLTSCTGCYWGIPWSNTVGTHPNPAGQNATSNEAKRAFDAATFGGGSASLGQQLVVPVSGQLWLYVPPQVIDADDIGTCGTSQPCNFPQINFKVFPTGVSAGPYPLVDISSPSTGNIIATDNTTPYTWCRARAVNQCRTGSAIGNVYFNVPGVNQIVPSGANAGDTFCAGGATHPGTPFGQITDICFGNQGVAQNTIRQFTLDQTDLLGAFTRTLVTADERVRMTYGLENNRVLPDNSWIVYRGEWLNMQKSGIWAAKIPPYPATDSVNRGTWIPVALSITPPGGTNNAIVSFGYQEYGTPSAFHCTSFADACIATASTVTAGNSPFFYASESPSGAACSSSCTITIPAISQRILYYQVSYRNSSNVVLSTSQVFAYVTP